MYIWAQDLGALANNKNTKVRIEQPQEIVCIAYNIARLIRTRQLSEPPTLQTLTGCLSETIVLI
jgi:transcription termination factor Rho